MGNSSFQKSSISTPVSVANGGTGATTLTDKGILYGNGTSAVGITAVGTATHVLTSNGVGVAPTFQAPAGGGGATCTTIVPTPNYNGIYNTASSWNSATQMSIGMISVPIGITVNKLSFYCNSTDGTGTLKIGLYNEAGTTLLLTAVSASISASGVKTITLGSPVTLAAGMYYVAAVPNAYWGANLNQWQNTSGTNNGLSSGISGKTKFTGYVTVTSYTLPATINPTTMTYEANQCLMIRLDN